MEIVRIHKMRIPCASCLLNKVSFVDRGCWVRSLLRDAQSVTCPGACREPRTPSCLWVELVRYRSLEPLTSNAYL